MEKSSNTIHFLQNDELLNRGILRGVLTSKPHITKTIRNGVEVESARFGVVQAKDNGIKKIVKVYRFVCYCKQALQVLKSINYQAVIELEYNLSYTTNPYTLFPYVTRISLLKNFGDKLEVYETNNNERNMD